MTRTSIIKGFAAVLGLAAFVNTASAEVPRIQWQTNLHAAYKEALASRKPLVVFFHFKSSQWCQKLERGPLQSNNVNQLAKHAIFAAIDIDLDDSSKNVSNMLKQLDLKEYPVVAVMDVSATQIVERGHIQGYFEEGEFYARLSRLFLNGPDKQFRGQ